ncbi:hypothetical protein BDZ88DRAFT_476951 [Geranomyces variabilis]|nr:hypothetical protein BDZ88DRAFT_476951 [Geranomyces variabilis]KAJ3135446.1 hypothetical protein HDU90_003848 [Geranomyces variabilis]
MKISLAITALAALSTAAAPAPIADAQNNLSLGTPKLTLVDQVASLVPGTTNTWHVNVHGYLTKPVTSSTLSGIFTVLKFLTGGDKSKVATLESRMQLFSMVGIPGTKINVALPASAGGKTVAVGTTDQTGLLDGTTDTPITGNPTSIDLTYVGGSANTKQVGGRAYLIPDAGVSVISDIDDTIKVTEVNSRTKLLEHTFLLPFTATPGFPELYQALNTELAAVNAAPTFHYLSRSPWNLYEPLAAFVSQFKFPAGQFILRNLSALDGSLLDFLVSGPDYKAARITEHLALFPKRQLVMIGDSTEQDPESYAAIAKASPGNVRCIAIRIVTGVDAQKEAPEISPARFATAFAGIPTNKWFTFTDAAQIDPKDIAAGNCRPKSQ